MLFRSGAWGTFTGDEVPDAYGSDVRYHFAGGTGEEKATWDAVLINGKGLYEVFVWYSANEVNAINARYIINHGVVSDTKEVDQTINGGQWFSLGTFSFENDGTENVTLSDEATGLVVIADAVKFVSLQ